MTAKEAVKDYQQKEIASIVRGIRSGYVLPHMAAALAKLEYALGSITYKPGWTFRIEPSTMDTLHLHLQWPLSYRPAPGEQGGQGGRKAMKKLIAVLAFAVSSFLLAQAPSGKWLDTTKEATGSGVFYLGSGGHVILAEDFEVVQTHEICAAVTGFFSDATQLGRYDVNFKGMRTSGTFVFTTRWDAEHWVTKWCTPQSLTQTKSIARSY